MTFTMFLYVTAKPVIYKYTLLNKQSNATSHHAPTDRSGLV